MRIISLLLLLLIPFLGVYAQCDFTSTTFPNGAYIRQITDYGATPDNPADNDYYAIVKTVEEVQRYVTANPGYYGIVLIPEGQYDIGELWEGNMVVYRTAGLLPVSGGTYTYFASSAYSNLKNLKIMGMSGCKKSVIRYKNDFKYGEIGGVEKGISTLFDLRSSGNVSLSNLEIDGNSEEIQYEGFPITSTPLHTGVRIYTEWYDGGSSERNCIEVKDMYIHSFAYDGLYVRCSRRSQAPLYNFMISNTTIANCGRQNLSITHGVNIHVSNSEFRHAGKFDIAGYDNNEHHPETNNPYRFNANSNVQIEPNDSDVIKNVVFDSCRILYDVYGRGPSLGIAGGKPDSSYLQNITFNYCEITSHLGAVEMVFTRSRNFTFNHCSFEGLVLSTTQATTYPYPPYKEITKYNNCVFKPYKNFNLPPFEDQNGSPVVWTRANSRFENCQFYTNFNPIYNNNSLAIGFPNYDTLINCTFNYDYKSNNTALPEAHFRNVYLNGNNTFTATPTSIPQTTSAIKYEDVKSLIVSGNADAVDPYQLNFTSGYRYYITRGGASVIFGQYPCEYLEVTVGSGDTSLLQATLATGNPFTTQSGNLYINENAVLRIKKGGKFWVGGNVYLAGKIIVEAGGRIEYMPTGNNVYYPSSLGAPDIVLEAGAISTGTPNYIAVSAAGLQPPPELLITENPCSSLLSKYSAGTESVAHSENSDLLFDVYPNPNKSKVFKFKVKGGQAGTSQLVVRDMDGRMLKSFNFNGEKEYQGMIDLENEIRTDGKVLLFTLYLNGRVEATEKVVYIGN